MYTSLKKLALAFLATLPLLLAGCRSPDSIVLWSPDGQFGLVLDGQQNALVDPAGAIVGQLGSPSDPNTHWEAQAWMPNSHRALAVRTTPSKSWDEYAALLGEERAGAVTRAADLVLGWIRDYRGDWKKFGNDDPRVTEWTAHLDFAPRYTLRSDDTLGIPSGPGIVLKFLQEKHPTEVAPLLQAEEIGPAMASATKVSELLIRDASPAHTVGEQILVRSADPIPWAQPSPDGRFIAFVRAEPEQPVLYVIDTQAGGKPVEVDKGVIEGAWTPDSRTLAYQKTTVPFAMVEQQAQLGTLTIHRVRNDDGTIPEKLPDPEDLAGVLFSKDSYRVACLPDGRFLFASSEVALPAIEPAKRLTLFALQPGETRTLQRVVRDADRGELPDRSDCFVVSPDGRHVALPGADGEVSVLSLETGAITSVQKAAAQYREKAKNENDARPPAPTWRGPGELCYVVPAGHPAASPRRAEVVLHPLGGETRTISRTWSDELTSSFLPRPKP